MTARTLFAGSALVALALMSAGCLDSLVGADCADGWDESGRKCVPSAVDPDAANPGDGGSDGGQDGSVGPDGAPDSDGGTGDIDGGTGDIDGGSHDGGSHDGGSHDGGSHDGGSQDGGSQDGGTQDGGSQDGGSQDAGTPDAGPVACDIGELECDSVCIDPSTDPDNCGSCGIDCGIGVCVEGDCQPICDPPLELCGNACVDLTTNPNHCGSCNNECDSGLCDLGLCQDAISGHVVVIGHDYRQSNEAMKRVLGNSVFLALGASIRVVTYEGDAITQGIGGADQAISQHAAQNGRTWQKINAIAPELVPVLLSDADVFLVYSQTQANNATLAALGAEWRVALDSFAHQGGVIVVLDGGGGHGGTFQVLEPAALFTANSRTVISTQSVQVVSPGDSVSSFVPLTYVAPVVSVSFDTAAATEVVQAPSGQPVVVHTPIF